MSTRDVDAFLAESQDVLDDYVTWHGSADSATWAADGSHEPDQISGDYYGDDYPMLGVGLFQVLPSRFGPGGHFGPGGFVEGEPDWSEIGRGYLERPTPRMRVRYERDEPPPTDMTAALARLNEVCARDLRTLRRAYPGHLIATIRYATDTRGRVARVSAVWDNSLSQEDQ